ncbi:MAG TPA: acetyl-CoA carboxylase biotin carboxyl carrier protein [Candidatus Acidoferrales bacterium]|nr:acetyl-CoA carboxylase biotin carboxyl carrier protein [Candidatus Acidoferrales bacterium]
MTLTAKDVAEIMRLLEQSSFDSLSLEIDGVKLNLQRGSAVPVHQAPAAAAPQPAASPQPAPTRKTKPPSEPGLAEVASPLLGIFYRAPKPGEPPFVEVGSKVNEETVVGIIEVMKLMNSVHAGVKGEVVEILAVNGTLVEYGEVLLRVRPEA